jgi:hypothetical protein
MASSCLIQFRVKLAKEFPINVCGRNHDPLRSALLFGISSIA